MKMRFRSIRRGIRGGTFYCVDTLTGKRTSLHTSDGDAARQIVLPRNQALRQPALNLNIAKAYLAGSDSGVATRTWQQAMATLVETNHGANQTRWRTAIKDHAFDFIRSRVIIETQGEHLLAVLRAGTVNTNVFLRKLHNFCLDMNWLPWPLIPKRQWPVVRFGEKRAITQAEHEAMVAREINPERKAFYQLAWHMGASQSDLAALKAEDIDWKNRAISFARGKTKVVAQIRLDDAIEGVLRSLPQARVHYLRFGRFFVILATHGQHPFFTQEAGGLKDIRETPITFHGYSIGYRRGWADAKWHPSVRIAEETHRRLRKRFEAMAVHRSLRHLRVEFQRLPFGPWAPVRQQLWSLVRLVNRRRKLASQEPLHAAEVKFRRRSIRPFDQQPEGQSPVDGSGKRLTLQLADVDVSVS